MCQLANKKRRCGNFPHGSSRRRESLVVIDDAQQLDPAGSWFVLGRELVVRKVRGGGGRDHNWKPREPSDVVECREAQEILSRKSHRSCEKYADIVIY